MYKRVLDIDYDALLEYMATLSEYSDTPDFFEFEQIQAYLSREVESMMTCDDADTAADPCLIDILMEDLDDETVLSYMVTPGPGRVIMFDGHPLMIPLVQIVVQWRAQWPSIPKKVTS